jgi:hypothetical protein
MCFLLVHVCLERCRTEAQAQAKKKFVSRYNDIHQASVEQNKHALKQETEKARRGLSCMGFSALEVNKAVATNGDDDKEFTPEVKVGLAEATMFLFDLRGCKEPAEDLDTTLEFIRYANHSANLLSLLTHTTLVS